MACGGQPSASSPIGQALREYSPLPLTTEARQKRSACSKLIRSGFNRVHVWKSRHPFGLCSAEQFRFGSTLVTPHQRQLFKNPVDPCPRRLVSLSVLLSNMPLNPLSFRTIVCLSSCSSGEASDHHEHHKCQTTIEHLRASFVCCFESSRLAVRPELTLLVPGSIHTANGRKCDVEESHKTAPTVLPFFRGHLLSKPTF